MKLIIPNEAQVGAHTYLIRVNEKQLDRQGWQASSTSKELIVRLATRDRQTSNIFCALMHEGLHLAGVHGGVELKEEEIVVLGEFLGQFLLSLGIEPDFSQVPEEYPSEEAK